MLRLGSPLPGPPITFSMTLRLFSWDPERTSMECTISSALARVSKYSPTDSVRYILFRHFDLHSFASLDSIAIFSTRSASGVSIVLVSAFSRYLDNSGKMMVTRCGEVVATFTGANNHGFQVGQNDGSVCYITDVSQMSMKTSPSCSIHAKHVLLLAAPLHPRPQLSDGSLPARS